MKRNVDQEQVAAKIISDLVCSTLLHHHEHHSRRFLNIWEAKALQWLYKRGPEGVNTWTWEVVQRYVEGRPVLPGWMTHHYPYDRLDDIKYE